MLEIFKMFFNMFFSTSSCSNRKHWKNILNDNFTNIVKTFGRTFWIFGVWELGWEGVSGQSEPSIIMFWEFLFWMFPSMFVAETFQKYFVWFVQNHCKNIKLSIQNNSLMFFIKPCRKCSECFFWKHGEEDSKCSLACYG